MTTLSFSTLWGSPDNRATAKNRPFIDDLEARRARDIEAAVLKAFGYKVRKHTLRGQVRQYWGWGEPCDRSACTVYRITIVAEPAVAA